MKTEMPKAHFVNLSLAETEALIARALPILKSVLVPEQWWMLIRDFFAMYHCCEPALHKVAEELLDYLDGEHRGGKPGFPGFLFDLAHFEWATLALAAAAPAPVPPIDADGDLLRGIPVAPPLLRIYVYDYPVHRIQKGWVSHGLAASAIHLALHADAAGAPRWLEIEAEAAALLERIEAEPGLSGIELQADEVLLASLRRRGLILGVLRERLPAGSAARTPRIDRPLS